MEGKDYDLRALAELSKTNPNFKDNPEKEKCFNEIIKECQEQEMQKVSFLKQEMMEDMMMNR